MPASGGALCAINTRLAPPEVRFIVEHCGAQVLLLDPELEAAAGRAVELPGLRVVRLGHRVRGAARRAPRATPPDWPDSEDRPISVDYTSGTTGTPKGVVYTHRGAYLGALAGLVETRLGPDSSYLWTLPMFHCNGWCFSWAVAGVGATSVVLRRPEPAAVWRELRAGATHLCAAPDGADHAARARRRCAARARRDLRRRRRAALADADRALRGAGHPARRTCTA